MSGGTQVISTTKVTTAKAHTLYANWIGAQAVYTEGNTTLTFVKQAPIAVGETLNGYEVTAVYTGIEEDTYNAQTDVPWNQYASVITTAIVEDEIQPVATRRWFNTMSNLTTADLRKLDTSKVTTMLAMFQNCSNLTELDVSGFNTSKVETMQSMFYMCTSLKTLDVSKWDTGNVTNMKSMFSSYQAYMALETLPISNWNTENVQNMGTMFQGCNKLTTLDLSKWNTENATDMSYMFNYCNNLTTLDLSKKTVTKEDGTNYTAWDTSNVTDMTYMFSVCKALTTLNVSGWNTTKVTTFKGMFNYCSSLTTLDVSNWNTESVTTMASMFSACNALTTLNVSGWNTAKVTSMRAMFSGCENLATLDVSNWNTESVTTMASMFNCCKKLTTLDVSNWKTGNVADMSGIFAECYEVTEIDVSEWDTKTATTMNYMFYHCHKVTKLDLSNFNTAKVTTANGMFTETKRLEEVIIGANFTFLSTATTVSTGSLPTPNSNYITGADGNWYNKATGAEYTAAEVAALPSGEARTFVAVDPKISIIFDANGGNVTGYNSTTTTLTGMPGLTYAEIDYGNGLPEAYWDGYNFLGWYTATTGGTQVNSTDTVTAAADGQTLYAMWEAVVIVEVPGLGDVEVKGNETPEFTYNPDDGELAGVIPPAEEPEETPEIPEESLNIIEFNYGTFEANTTYTPGEYITVEYEESKTKIKYPVNYRSTVWSKWLITEDSEGNVISKEPGDIQITDCNEYYSTYVVYDMTTDKTIVVDGVSGDSLMMYSIYNTTDDTLENAIYLAAYLNKNENTTDYHVASWNGTNYIAEDCDDDIAAITTFTETYIEIREETVQVKAPTVETEYIYVPVGTLKAEEGMTWAKWLASSYNTTGETEPTIKTADFEDVAYDDVIEAGESYGFVKYTLTLTPSENPISVTRSKQIEVYIETTDDIIFENISEYISVSSADISSIYISQYSCTNNIIEITVFATGTGSSIITVEIAESDYWYSTSTTINATSNYSAGGAG